MKGAKAMNQEILLIPPLIMLFAMPLIFVFKAYKDIKDIETRKSKQEQKQK